MQRVLKVAMRTRGPGLGLGLDPGQTQTELGQTGPTCVVERTELEDRECEVGVRNRSWGGSMRGGRGKGGKEEETSKRGERREISVFFFFQAEDGIRDISV